jgi:hypothetical protein
VKEGFLWWNQAFEAAGYKNALEIRDMPRDMDSMDIRYNQIYWVDRDERGYSTGGGLNDPRTGEILAARVRLESDRVRSASNYWRTYMPAPPAGRMVKISEQPENQKSAMMDSFHERQSVG